VVVWVQTLETPSMQRGTAKAKLKTAISQHHNW
jgi:hypothetical protein